MTPVLTDLLRAGRGRDTQMAEISKALDALKPGEDRPSVAAARVVLHVAGT